MSSGSTNLLKVSLIGDKKEIIDFLNVVMRNRGIFSPLTLEDTLDKINEVIKILESSGLKCEDFISRYYYDYPDFQLKEGMITQQEYNEWVKELSRKRDRSEVQFDKLVILSNGDYLLQIIDYDIENIVSCTWEDIVSNLDSIKECVIDSVTIEDFKGYFIWEYYDSTKIIRKDNGNIHIDIYPRKNYEVLMNGDKYPLHFGLMIYQELWDSVEWCTFLLEEVARKPEGEHLVELLREKSEKESFLNSHKEKLSLISGLENNENLIENLKSMEYIK